MDLSWILPRYSHKGYFCYRILSHVTAVRSTFNCSCFKQHWRRLIKIKGCELRTEVVHLCTVYLCNKDILQTYVMTCFRGCYYSCQYTCPDIFPCWGLGLDRKGHCTSCITTSSCTWDCECSHVSSCSWWQVFQRSGKPCNQIWIPYMAVYNKYLNNPWPCICWFLYHI